MHNRQRPIKPLHAAHGAAATGDGVDCDLLAPRPGERARRRTDPDRFATLQSVTHPESRGATVAVRCKYDPLGQTDRYFDVLRIAMARANGSWSRFVVNRADGMIIDADPHGRPATDAGHDDFRSPPDGVR